LPARRQSKEQKIETDVLGSKDWAFMQITKKSLKYFYLTLFYMKFL